jgi:hypothetical protein
LADVRVGRWMSIEEHDAMVLSGRVQESHSGQTNVLRPADRKGWHSAKTATIYVEFDIDESRLELGGKKGWAIVAGPNSVFGRLAARRGTPIIGMPDVRNLEIVP